MISARLTDFLEALKKHNDRDWFQKNKKWYDEVKSEFDEFTIKLIATVAKIDKDVAYLEPKDCTYRIYRDTRFSGDKTPYKTNFGAYLVKGGKKSGFAGYYFHIEPGSNMLAGGIYMPMPDVLKKLRREIYENIDEFIEIVENREFVKHFGHIDDESKLKTPPKDFPKDFPHIEYLKFKNYTVAKNLAPQMLHGPKLMEEVITVFKALVPLNKFLNNALS
jgi:TIGR02453 family protein